VWDVSRGVRIFDDDLTESRLWTYCGRSVYRNPSRYGPYSVSATSRHLERSYPNGKTFVRLTRLPKDGSQRFNVN
jgi:hypothetical protein